MPEPDWKRYGYSSLEAYIESKAGACPPEPCPFCGTPGMAVRVDHSHEQPLPPSPFDLSEQLMGGTVDEVNDWPMPEPPPYPADDEALEAP